MFLDQKVLHSLRLLQIKKGSTILLGVSGGVDSIVMAHIIHGLKDTLGIRLYIAHFNHRLRKTSTQDELVVSRMAKDLNIPLIVGRRSRVTVKKTSEEQARMWRFDFFAKSMKQSRADILMLAHHQNDLAETLLMRLLRGSGLHGLRGILKSRYIYGMYIVRPLLDFSRAEIEAYAKAHRLAFCHDESNDTDMYLRNKIRHTLIPQLCKDYNPALVRSLAQLAACAGDDYAYLNAAAQKRLKENIVLSQQSAKIRIRFFQKEPMSIIRLGLRALFETFSGDLNQLTFDHVQMVYDLAATGSVGSLLNWPNAITNQKD